MIADLAGIVVILILIGIAVFSPPLMLAIYSLFSNIGDGFGIGYLIRTLTSPLYTAFLSLLLLLAVLASFVRLYKQQGNRQSGKRSYYLGTLVLASTLWIGFLVVLKGGEVLSIPNSMTNFGIPGMIIVLAYYQSRFAKYLFFTFLFVQLVLAFSIIIFPDSPLASLSGLKYEASGIDDVSLFPQTYAYGIARLTSQERLFAQFYNPNGYGFYAIIGIITGGYVLLNKTYSKVVRFLGFGLILFGLFGWSVTFSRGSTIGLVLGGFFVSMMTLRRASKKIKVLLILFGLLPFILTLFILPIPWNNLGEISYNEVDITFRGAAFYQGVRVFIDHPLIGAPLNFEWQDGIPPHQIIIYSAVIYGVFMGLLVTLIFIWATLGNIFNRAMTTRDKGLVLVIFWATICTGLTNNFAVPILFWVCVAISCIPWCLRPNPGKGQVSLGAESFYSGGEFGI